MSSILQLASGRPRQPISPASQRHLLAGALGLLFVLSAGLAGQHWRESAAPPGQTDPAVPLAVAAPANPPVTANTALQQFTAGGHLLGFGVGQVYLASGSHALQVQFLDAQPVAPQSASAGGAGQPPKAPALSEVRYPNLWPGVDLSYRAASDGIAESVWRLAPGADVEQIRLRYNRPLALNSDGSLAIRFDTGVLNESAPVAWQERDGQRQPVAVAFALKGEQELGFTLGAHDSGLPVWIDPTLTWNTFLGGVGDDFGYAIATGDDGFVYVAGKSNATWGNPVRAYTGGDHDAYVAKLDSNGKLIWHTFLGGAGADLARGIVVDGSGNVWAAGQSNATWGNDATVRGFSGGDEAFVARLDRNGALVWNAFLGAKDGRDSGAAIAVDGAGKVYVGGTSSQTWCANPPPSDCAAPVRAHSGGNDAFAAHLDSDGTLIWYTFLGSSASDAGRGIAVNSVGQVYVSGASGRISSRTWCPKKTPPADCPDPAPVQLHKAGQDAFAAQLDDHGKLLWYTFLGGSGKDTGAAIAVDGDGRIYVSGSSSSAWGKAPARAYRLNQDAFAAQLDASGALVWHTFLGGVGDDIGRAIAADGSGRIFVSGGSDASWGSPARAFSGYKDAFAVQLDSTGKLISNTFLGGLVYKGAGFDMGYGIAVDATGQVYATGFSTGTWGAPLRGFTPNSFDAFVARLKARP